MNHVNITNNCLQCHASGSSFANMAPPTLKVPSSNHIPTTQTCEVCHSASNFASGAFNAAAMSHTGITSGCATCHATGKTFANMAPPTLKLPPTNHVPFASAACESCHSASVFTSFAMTNNSTDMNHTVVTSAVCSTCHEKGKTWVGTPATVVRPALKANGQAHVPGGECSNCHFNTTSFKGATDLPGNHIPLPAADNGNCTLCHSNANDYSVYAMNHVNITNNCLQCHASGSSFANMAPPTLKVPSSNHIPTTQNCEVCHSASNFATGAFNTATMSHTGITSGCATCHATGKTFANMVPPTLKLPPTNHVPFASAACESCHSKSVFTSFAMTNNSTDMNHTVVTSLVCSTCHEKGKTWAGTPATVVRPTLKANGQAHVPGGECSNCHFNTTSFKGATDYPANHIPVPTADNNDCTLCHSNANDYSVYSMNHVNITSNCLQCHAAGSSFANMAPPTLKVPSTNHIPTTKACETCHAATNFATGAFNSATMNHTGITSGCATCHANGKTFTNMAPPTLVVAATNHIPTTQACETCHSASNFATGAFNTATMSHTGITSGCATCHATGSTFANMAPPTLKLPPTNHVPFASAACESCHSKTVFTSFVMTNNTTNMNHTVVTSLVCSTCHEKGKTWAGTPATVVRPALKANGQAHVTGGECSTCHFNTTSFKGATDLPGNHIPLPTADNGNCALCHKNTNDYSTYTMNHVNITSNCAQCHAYGLSFANIAAPALKQPTAGAAGHIPSNPPNGTAAIACESCHSATVFTTFSGTVMKHAVVTALKCLSCHENGMTWQTNTRVTLWTRPTPNDPNREPHAGKRAAPNDCNGSGCHNSRDKRVLRPAALTAVKPKTGTAATTTATATTAAKAGTIPANVLNALRGGMFGGMAINHASVTGTSCVSCHSAAHGLGKDATHPATSDNCASCHTTLAWLPVSRVDHSQVRGTCASCHDGKAARGKSLTHITSGTACESCHTTNAWTPARFDHAAVSAGACKSCHDGVHAPGLAKSHIATSASCDACHGTLGWTPVKVDHRALKQGCASCHNGGPATGLTLTHMSTRKDCATCHVYPNWTPVVFTHTSAAFPGNHHGSLTCANCHTTNADTVPYAFAADAGSCGGCHNKDFKSASHPKVAGGANYTASELKNCTGACHVYSDDTLRGVAHPKPGPYHRVTDAAFKH